jgi:HSP20 family protein
MNVRDLIPWSRQRERLPSMREDFGNGGSPFLALHREINRLFDDAFRGFDGLPGFSRALAWPSVEVSDADTELRVTVELPGMEEKDIDLALQDGVLTIRGEKHEETTGEDRAYSERLYGRFERRIPLGFEVDDARAEARFANGVLTIVLPKSPEAQKNVKRIPIAGDASR